MESPSKMRGNGCSLSMIVSYTIGKPKERRFQKDQKFLTHPTHFLPCPEIGNRPKMTQNDPEPIVVPKWLFFKYESIYTFEKTIESKFLTSNMGFGPTLGQGPTED